MSEKLYALLLRLYPAAFRRRYAEEAMQVFRDRLRDEHGVLRRTRLWLDVLIDVSLSAPRERRRIPAGPAPAPGGVPSFLVLEDEPLRPNMFVAGTVLALLAVGTFGFLLTHGGNRFLFPSVTDRPLRSAMAPAVDAGNTEERPVSHPESATSEAVLIGDAERRLVIRRVIRTVQQSDPDAAESQSVAAMLAYHQSRGDYMAVRSGPVFAHLLTGQINGIAQQVTVNLMCGQQPAPGSPLWTASWRPRNSILERINDHFAIALAPVDGRQRP